MTAADVLTRRAPPANPAVSRAERTQLTDDLFERAGLELTTAREATLQHIVVLNVPTAKSIARRYRDRGVELDDLEQTACVALLQAVRGFDPTLGHGFLAYALPTIRGALCRHFRDLGWMIKPPRSVQELQPRIRAFAFDRDPNSGRPLTLEQVAQRLGAPVGVVREAAEASGCYRPSSLDAPTDPTGVTTLVDRLPGRGDPGFGAAEARSVLSSVLAGLNGRDRMLLQLRFVEEQTQQHIADELGLTQSQVSRRLVRVITELRRLSPDEAAS